MTSSVEISQKVVVQTQGAVGADSVKYARDKMTTVLRRSSYPVLYARVRLTQSPDPAVSRPAVAQANLAVNGHQLPAHAAARTMHEAIDLLQARLRQRQTRLARYRASGRRVARSASTRRRGWEGRRRLADRS
jgi:ribosome-associated translation inhibitor RaiA